MSEETFPLRAIEAQPGELGIRNQGFPSTPHVPGWAGAKSEIRNPKFPARYCAPTNLLYSQAKTNPPIAPSIKPQIPPITAPT